MKAITLHQPWASLIAAGYKTVETRSWPTNHRGPIAIHAGRTSAYEGIRAVAEAVRPAEQFDAGAAGVVDALYSTIYPLGAVVAVANLVDCVRMDAEIIAAADPLERALGDWRSDRYGWQLADVQPIKPIPCRGAQGIWQLDMATSAAVAGAVAVGVA